MKKGNRKEKSAMVASGLSEAKFKFLWDRLDAKVKKNCSGVAIGTIMKIAYKYGHSDGYNAGIFIDSASVYQKIWQKRKTHIAYVGTKIKAATEKIKTLFKQ